VRLEILPVHGIGEVVPGDDIAALIAAAAPWLCDGDVLVVTSKIVSKAEGRLVELPADEPGRGTVRAEVLAAETAQPVARRGPTQIVRTRHGFVMAAAGVDNSNVRQSQLVLLPVDPDASARAVRSGLRERIGVEVAVIVSDTMGRPWRHGLTDVALGAAGIVPIRDHRGETDRYGNELRLTQMAVIDELAAAGELVKGKCDQVPVAVVRGYPWSAGSADGPGAVALIRGPDEDLFPLGTAEARAAGLRAAATLTDADGGPTGQAGDDPTASPVPVTRVVEPVTRAVELVAGVVAPGTRFRFVPGPPPVHRAGAHQVFTGYVLCRPPDGPADLVRFGADVHRLRAALAAEGVTSAHLADDDPEPGAIIGLSATTG